MNIDSAQYVNLYMGDTLIAENDSIIATIDGQKMAVPKDPANRHYATILEWAEEDGNEIQAAE